MAAILGIDAAWTSTQPSGVAVVAGRPGSWRLLTVASSYGDFYRLASGGNAVDGFDARLLLDTAATIASEPVQLIAADIPLAHSPIVGRRESDNAVSRLYGARHAGTHSPSALRPGPLADQMRAQFYAEGYALQTVAPTAAGLLEVYPHPALIELTAAMRRLPYKSNKTASYWPGLTALERRSRLIGEWRAIVSKLGRWIGGIDALLQPPEASAPGRRLKAFEDALDAVVCAWIGTRVMEGCAIALGDADSAIWVPTMPPVAVSGWWLSKN